MTTSREVTDRTHVSARGSIPKATVGETLGVLFGVMIPTVLKGVIIRRPKVVAMAERLDLDTKAVKRMQRLRNKHGTGPLLLRIPFRSQAVVLAPEHVHHVLENSPEPFATATMEKRAALAHFEPKGALISHGPERTERRQFNERVLGHTNPMHELATRFVQVVDEEGDYMLTVARRQGELNWAIFSDTWFRIVRRVVFGDGARDDHELRQIIDDLRADANWAFLKPKNKELRRRFFDRLNSHLARAEPGSLAGVMAATPITEESAPSHQVPQWLFAFDPAGMTTFRSLALLASHPEQARRAREEIAASDPASQPLDFLRACVLESLRLWPTTPAVLRETTRPVTWETGVMPPNTNILIFAPFFHRDDERLDYANRFEPEVWLKERTSEDWPLIPFSGGPGICPGRHVVLLVSTAMLSKVLTSASSIEMMSPDRLRPDKPLPGTLNNYSLRFRLGN